jgi:hypothetical protein
MKMMIKPLAAIVTTVFIGIGTLAHVSDVSARTLRHHRWSAHYGYVPSERPPAGQIYERAFSHPINVDQAQRQDFQLDGRQ